VKCFSPRRRLLSRTLLSLASFGLAALVGASASAAATVTIGQASGDVPCGSDLWTFATSGSVYTVPAGTWRITSWSTLAGTSGGQMAAVVVRPTGAPDSYEVVGVSATETLAPNVVNTFSTSIAVRAGDILGLWGSDVSTCGSILVGGNTYGVVAGAKPSVGQVFTVTPFQEGFPDISASLSSTAAPRQPDRFGYCSVAGNTWQDGSPIPPGSFLNLLWEQPKSDSHYTGATIANFVLGKGITCDPPPPGYVQQGYATDDMHVPHGTYPLWVPAPASS
jgi:hypothetical protein